MGHRRADGQVRNRMTLRDLFQEIRRDAEEASSREELTELHRRASYLVALTQSTSWSERFGAEIAELRSIADDEFTRAARVINERAREIGTSANYDEDWSGSP